MQDRKSSTWKKSRTQGDLYGGRQRLRLADNVFKRFHSLYPPGEGDVTPILLEDNPSRDFMFPLTGAEVTAELRKKPEESAGLTHIWLKKIRKRDYESGRFPLASYLWGSGVQLIVLYPWPADLILRFGRKRPAKRVLTFYSAWTTDLFERNGQWCLRWTEVALKKFYLECLLLHELGHHVDFFWRGTRSSKANRRQTEEFAEQYSLYWAARSRTGGLEAHKASKDSRSGSLRW